MRLIDADKITPEYLIRAFGVVTAEYVNDFIKSQPTVETEPRHGYWISYKDEHRCSVCGEVVCEEVYDQESTWGSQGIYEYCPYCGAKMERCSNGLVC